MAGAPLGNQNSTRQRRLFTAALRRKSAQNPERVDALAEQLFRLAEAGEAWAFKELLDRLDGKAPQPVTGGDEEDSSISVVHEILIRAVNATSDRPPTEGG